MRQQSDDRPSKLQQKGRQFIDERMELLDTIREMVGEEVDRRMEQWAQRQGEEPEVPAAPTNTPHGG